MIDTPTTTTTTHARVGLFILFIVIMILKVVWDSPGFSLSKKRLFFYELEYITSSPRSEFSVSHSFFFFKEVILKA